MINTIQPIPVCKVCRMELLAYVDEYGEIVRPHIYCDSICKDIYSKYKKMFLPIEVPDVTPSHQTLILD